MDLATTHPRAPVEHGAGYLGILTLGALGVVFGDIGTSSLYALRECFHGVHSLPLTEGNVLGILSLIIWSLILILSVKYLLFVMRADNRGEGGVLALMALVAPAAKDAKKGVGRAIVLMGIFGAALLYGDGMITPAISVLSAVEGLEIATPMFKPYIIPITVAVLCLLFLAQKGGTARIGAIFGPIIVIWFLTLAWLGYRGIMMRPGIATALNPLRAAQFIAQNTMEAFLSLGVVILAVTGAEALYADMGHFGRKPIRLAWHLLVLPSLVLNYLGQGALLLEQPAAASNPFYLLAPPWALYPLVCLSTIATVIASQALISGAFSITKQAVSLGYLPRMTITHTSRDEIGQIYVPFVNWSLLLCTIGLVLFFETSSNLAAAYGLAVTTTMVITTILTYFVTRKKWHWNLYSALLVGIPFLFIDLSFFGASILKIPHGGWFPLAIGIIILTCMTTWRRGRELLANRLRSLAMTIPDFLEMIERKPPIRVPGTAIFMTSTMDYVPSALLHNVRHNQILHDSVVLMTVTTAEVPHVPRDERFCLETLKDGFYSIAISYGFMDTPNVAAVLMRCEGINSKLNLEHVTYFLGRETVLATTRPGMAVWRESIFSFMSRNAQRATTYFRIPSHQVVEIGIQIEM